MVSREAVRFHLARVGGFFKLILSNKMSAVGLFLLLLFSFMALGSPLLTPYQPTEIVSGSLAQPEWVMNFPDGYYLSKNILFSDNPSFRSPASLQAWELTPSSGTLSSMQISYDPNVSRIGNSSGSIHIVHTGTDPATVSFTRTLHYPYHGPPKKFIASFQLLLTGASQAQPVGVRLFVDRVGDQAFNIYRQNETLNGQWAPPPTTSLDSGNPFVITAVSGTDFSVLNPAEIIFSASQSYTFGIELSFTGPQSAYLDDLQLKLFGTAFGLFGTDAVGVDLYSQVVYGSQISLLVGLTAAAIGIALGLAIGLVAGFLGRNVDEVLMRFTDMMLVIPSLPLLIVLIAVLSPSIWNVIIIIGLLGWMGFARIVRSQVLTLKERPFVEAARASGAGPIRIMTRHVFPNIVSLTYVNLALSVPGAILAESALAFLGLSDPSVISWGNIFADIREAGALILTPPPWWWVLPPGFAIALVSLSFILIGYSLDEIFNPKLRKRR